MNEYPFDNQKKKASHRNSIQRSVDGVNDYDGVSPVETVPVVSIQIRVRIPPL